jgi:polar amino acid transport system substrate-binding protein
LVRINVARRVLFLAVVGASVFAIAACGSSNKKTTSSTTPASTGGTVAGADPKIAAEVPAAIKSKGTLTVAADASYAPNEFVAPDGKTVIGVDPDLMKALAGLMGLKTKVVNVTFDSIIPGMAAGKYDVGASSFTDTKAREKTVDFVTYLSVGEAFLSKASGGPKVNKLSDICGLSVSVEKGTVELTDAQTQNKKCTTAGKPAIKLLVFPDQNGANLALQSGRAQVDFADSPIIAYQVRQLGVDVRSSPTFNAAPYGLALPKGNGMAKPVLDALKELMANGGFAAILKKWQLQSAAITNPVINGATS